MKTIGTILLIFCIIAGQSLCFADMENTQNAGEVTIVLRGMDKPPPTSLVKFVFSGDGSDTIQFSIADTEISTKTELSGDDVENTRLNVKLLDEDMRPVTIISKSMGPAHTYNNLSLKEGTYTLDISQSGPGDWEIALIVPDMIYFLSSDYESKTLFYEPE